MVWSLIVILLVALLLVNYQYLRRSQSQVQEYWQELEKYLQERLKYITQYVESVENATDQAEALNKDLNMLKNRQDPGLKRLRQRGALESRLSRSTQKLLDMVDIDDDTQNQLHDLDDHIQVSLRYYEISANSYNAQRQSFPNNLYAGMLGFDKAPEIEIQKIYMS